LERLGHVRTVFIGTPAFLGRVDGETRCAFWSEEPVDRRARPQAARASLPISGGAPRPIASHCQMRRGSAITSIMW
jgi:hypothetical protein